MFVMARRSCCNAPTMDRQKPTHSLLANVRDEAIEWHGHEGPSVLVPLSAVRHWRGREPASHARSTHYDRAMMIADAVTTMQVGMRASLLLSTPGPCACVASSASLCVIKWIEGPSAEAVLSVVRMVTEDEWQALGVQLEVDSTDPWVVHDASRSGLQVAGQASFALQSGVYAVEAIHEIAAPLRDQEGIVRVGLVRLVMVSPSAEK